MQISLNLNLIINEVSDSQITSSRQKLADTSARGPRLASAGSHAKPLLVVAAPRVATHGGRGEGTSEAGVLAAGAPTTTEVQAIYPFRQLAHTVLFGKSHSSNRQVGTERRTALVNNYCVLNSTFNTMHLYLHPCKPTPNLTHKRIN